ncbi:hypothetical protein HD554DRAFT_1982962, partial [Boletus coccyginus]
VVAWFGIVQRVLEASVTPDLAIANHLYYLGDIPEQLTGLTVIEEAVIAHCRAQSCIVQLREGDDTSASNAQRGMRGHIILILDLLPPSMERLSTFICVLFVGSQTPSEEWMCKHTRLLLVR